MNQETNRLNTFRNWPSTAPVDAGRIAKAGFFYTGYDTEVECFSCGGKISEWSYGDQVMWRHRQMEPNCAFVSNPLLSGNVPLVVGRDYNTSQHSEEIPILGNEHSAIESSADYGLIEEDEMYKSNALRLLSFVNWDDPSVSREELVSAGFYHAGGGRIRCAWCGGEIAPMRNLGSIGTPLAIHRLYFPRCTHAFALEDARRTEEFSPPNSPPSYTPPIQSPAITNVPQSSGAEHNARVIEEGGEWKALGVVSVGAKHPSKGALAARLSTYGQWPADRVQAPKTLADAGFFYTGVDDQVRCFYCDGGLGKWEADDVPWSEHAHWFPHCGFVLLVKGQEFVDTCRNRVSVQRTIEECMESSLTSAAFDAGLDAARIRRAIFKRLRSTGMPFITSEALIDAVLDQQLSEEAWSMSPRSHRLACDILAESLRDYVPRAGIIPSNTDSEPTDSDVSQTDSPSLTETNVPTTSNRSAETEDSSRISNIKIDESDSNSEKKQMTLEEENRQLKEARMCKVCMDNEVSVVFLPCGHLVSCAGCGAALRACPLCRAAVRALVRAYLA